MRGLFGGEVTALVIFLIDVFMRKDEVELTESQEFFELTLNVETSRVPAAHLIEYLRNTDKLFKSINQTLNEKYAIGYNEITLEVVPFEEGSFKIPIWIMLFSLKGKCALG